MSGFHILPDPNKFRLEPGVQPFYGFLGRPEAIAATDIMHNSFSANWLALDDATGYRLTVATDPIFVNIIPGFNGLDVGAVLTYNVSGLNAYTDYYYVISAYNLATSSGYSNAVITKTSIPFTITARGDGLGVASFSIEVLSECLIHLDGAAMFYSNSGGTNGESSSWLCTPGALRTRYVRCPSGTANLVMENPELLLKFGNVIDSLGYTYPGWATTTGVTSNVPSLTIHNLIDVYFPNVIHIGCRSSLVLYTTSTSLVPRYTEKLQLDFACSISGNISNLPSTLKLLTANGPNTLSGDIASLSPLLESLHVAGSNTITGDIDSFSDNFTYLSLTGSNTIYGDIGDLPSAVTYFNVSGNNTLSGDVVGITANPGVFVLYGNNTITGDIANLPRGVGNLMIAGSNSLYGNLDDVPPASYQISITGNNVIGGGFSGIGPSCYYVSVWGNNVISDDIANIPSSVRTINITGANTIYGLLSNLSSIVQALIVHGNNTIGGDIGGTVTGLYQLDILGYNTISDYSGKSWNTFQNRLIITPVAPGGLSSVEIDQLLIDINSDCTFAGSSRVVSLLGANAAPTAASAAARASLVAKGVTLYTN